jgi:hypothetical protein
LLLLLLFSPPALLLLPLLLLLLLLLLVLLLLMGADKGAETGELPRFVARTSFESRLSPRWTFSEKCALAEVGLVMTSAGLTLYFESIFCQKAREGSKVSQKGEESTVEFRCAVFFFFFCFFLLLLRREPIHHASFSL